MPIQLRPKARVQTVRPPKREAIAPVDGLGVWSLSVGFCAVVLASIAYFVARDNVGAALILAGTAGIIALMVMTSGATESDG